MSQPPLFSFANDAHDRRTELRSDPDELQRRWDAPGTAVLLVGDARLPTNGDTLRWLAPADAPAGERIYLGSSDGFERFALLVERVPQKLHPQSIRTIGAVLDPSEAGLAVHALGLGNWHRTHPRCSRCGAATVTAEGGHQRRCPECAAVHFPRTDPAVIMLATDDADRALLGRQRSWPTGRYSTLAGFVEPGESLEDAVRREIHEESGVRIGDVRYAGSQPWPFPASLMLGFFAHADSTDIEVDGDELEDARWFDREQLTELTRSGEVALPGRLSISRWLIESWHGGTVTGAWQ